jgi:hypothetical protein
MIHKELSKRDCQPPERVFLRQSDLVIKLKAGAASHSQRPWPQCASGDVIVRTPALVYRQRKIPLHPALNDKNSAARISHIGRTSACGVRLYTRSDLVA